MCIYVGLCLLSKILEGDQSILIDQVNWISLGSLGLVDSVPAVRCTSVLYLLSKGKQPFSVYREGSWLRYSRCLVEIDSRFTGVVDDHI